MKLYSILIPARNEEGNIINTIQGICSVLDGSKINFEIIVVNDGSTDATLFLVENFARIDQRVKVVTNQSSNGIGNAIKYGLNHFAGDYVVIVMADSSDEPKDIVKYIHQVEKGYDCCFGSRWQKESLVQNYPKHKLFLNRVVNFCVCVLFQLSYTDITNAFKCYSREAIHGIFPILSRHFNITVELPLKAIVRGYTFTVVPTNWYGRKIGKSSLKLKEMGSRYLFVILYIFLERLLCGDDYKRIKR